MKKLFKQANLIGLMAVSMAFAACGSSKAVMAQQEEGSPFGDTYEAPCQFYDTKQEFAGWGESRGAKNEMGVIHQKATASAQNNVRQKVRAAYKGMISTYSGSHGNNQGNDIEDKFQTACDQALDGILNDTETACSRWGKVGEDGHLSNFVGIKISKEELATKTASAVEDKLTEDEKLRIDFNEANFREEMLKRMEQFKEERK